MRVFSKHGARLYKRMQVKIFPPAGKTRTIVLRAPAGKWITAETIEKQLEQAVEGVEKAWPRHEFRLVPIGAAAFNFVCNGERKIDSELTTQSERSSNRHRSHQLPAAPPRAALKQALPWPDACLDCMALLAVALVAYLFGRYHGMKAAERKQQEREELKRW